VRIPTSSSKADIEVAKSKFFSTAGFFDDPGSIKATIQSVREKYPDCSHVVHAYVVGPTASVFGMSDDREPKNTAGRPVLEVVKGSGITNVLVTVVRYYGGTNLGTGGLVRAYTRSAQLALERLKTEELTPRVTLDVVVPYPLYEKVATCLLSFGGVVENETFEEAVKITGILPARFVNDFTRTLSDLSSGSLIPQFYEGSKDS
jgi:uncharacterized YigZ family protein